ncbi:Cold shock-like protein [Anaerohalosphaera lusitana]|uniref:Cold shock-like protein n=1 Tax=Anaerohalosphaera lusitana TaxID=1936003 RepID=A0A1U9NNP1_9BACT|nr:cold shock domain-containing protein [Anaerohalosphaera lusitana]AQT69417.1 Cold shock-like protein [Anaerohalosphaera lusitana]
MSDGIVKWFDRKKGYGFISCGPDPDVFIHHSNLVDRAKLPNEGDRVQFEVESGEKGPVAKRVAIV